MDDILEKWEIMLKGGDVKDLCDLLINKWKVLLEYTSKDVATIDESKWGYVAFLMEEMEKKLIELEKNFDGNPATNLAKRLICQIRRNQGPLEEVMLDEKRHYIIENWESWSNKYEKYAIYPEEYNEYHAFGRGYKPCGYILHDGKWEKNW
jgi:hypothetical protein